MTKLGDIIMYDVIDICKAFHIGKVKAYKLLHLKEAHAVHLGKKILISEENLNKIMNAGKRI